jgi:hypothetical protein
MLLGYAQLLGNLADAQELRLLGDFDVGQWHFFFLYLWERYLLAGGRPVGI